MHAQGERGYSAYEVAQNNGFTGTEQEWLTLLYGNESSVAEGQPNATAPTATGLGSLAIGSGATANGAYNTVMGSGSSATGDSNTVVGKQNKIMGNRSGAFGDPNIINANDSYAFGNDNTVSGDRTFVLGNNVKTSAKNAVVLGHDSSSIDAKGVDRDQTVSVGATGNERQIIHVADGTAETDAVNYRQLETAKNTAKTYTDNRVNSLNNVFNEYRMETEQRFHNQDIKIDRVAAMSGAFAGMAMNTANLSGRNRVALGVASHSGEEAIAIGYQVIPAKNTSASIGAAFADGERTVNAGIGFSW